MYEGLKAETISRVCSVVRMVIGGRGRQRLGYTGPCRQIWYLADIRGFRYAGELWPVSILIGGRPCILVSYWNYYPCLEHQLSGLVLYSQCGGGLHGAYCREVTWLDMIGRQLGYSSMKIPARVLLTQPFVKMAKGLFPNDWTNIKGWDLHIYCGDNLSLMTYNKLTDII